MAFDCFFTCSRCFVIYFGQFNFAIVQFGIQILIWAMFLSKDLLETLDIISKYFRWNNDEKRAWWIMNEMKWGKPLRNQIEQKHPFSKLTSISISNLTIENYRKKFQSVDAFELCVQIVQGKICYFKTVRYNSIRILLEFRIVLIFPFFFFSH